jgi:hypothetical protein
MATLNINCKSIKLRNIDRNLKYFVLLQFQQENNLINTQKQRTEFLTVPMDTKEELRFQKNMFRFSGLDPFKELNVKIGIFTGESADVVGSGELKMDSVSLHDEED